MFLLFSDLRGSNFEPQYLEIVKRYLKKKLHPTQRKKYLKKVSIKNRVNLLIFPIYTSKYAKTLQFSHPKEKKYTNQGPFPWQRDKIIAYFQYAFFVN